MLPFGVIERLQERSWKNMGLRWTTRVSGCYVSAWSHEIHGRTAKAIEVDPKYAKAYYRYVGLSRAYMDMHHSWGTSDEQRVTFKSLNLTWRSLISRRLLRWNQKTMLSNRN